MYNIYIYTTVKNGDLATPKMMIQREPNNDGFGMIWVCLKMGHLPLQVWPNNTEHADKPSFGTGYFQAKPIQWEHDEKQWVFGYVCYFTYNVPYNSDSTTGLIIWKTAPHKVDFRMDTVVVALNGSRGSPFERIAEQLEHTHITDSIW